MNKKIQESMALAFEVGTEAITEQITQDDIENWDSLHHIKLIVLLERAFDIEIPDDRVGNMISYSLIETVVNECLGS
jgi:acyl carrier protein